MGRIVMTNKIPPLPEVESIHPKIAMSFRHHGIDTSRMVQLSESIDGFADDTTLSLRVYIKEPIEDEDEPFVLTVGDATGPDSAYWGTVGDLVGVLSRLVHDGFVVTYTDSSYIERGDGDPTIRYTTDDEA